MLAVVRVARGSLHRGASVRSTRPRAGFASEVRGIDADGARSLFTSMLAAARTSCALAQAHWRRRRRTKAVRPDALTPFDWFTQAVEGSSSFKRSATKFLAWGSENGLFLGTLVGGFAGAASGAYFLRGVVDQTDVLKVKLEGEVRRLEEKIAKTEQMIKTSEASTQTLVTVSPCARLSGVCLKC